MSRKKEVEKLVTVHSAIPVLICRANRPLTEEQHDELVRKLKTEQDRSGIEIVLIPYSVDLEVTTRLKENTIEPGDLAEKSLDDQAQGASVDAELTDVTQVDSDKSDE